MKLSLSFVAILLLPGAALADDLASLRPEPPKEPPRSPFVFSLVPKSLQKHPALEFHVISEMTEEGRKAPQATPEHPIYFIEQAGKFTQLGNNVPANEHAPSVSDLTRAMENSLAASYYLPATKSRQQPSLAIVFNFGSFARFSTEAEDFEESMAVEEVYRQMNPDDPAPAPFIRTGEDRDADSLLAIVLANPTARADVIQRAELIGGQRFARELRAVLNQEAEFKENRPPLGIPGIDSASPFHRFMNANADVMSLVEESFSSCYFVVASAYDFAAMTKGRRVLLWRTKMTVNSSGISMTESLPSLIVSAGPYFGRDMTDSVTLTRRISRGGKVEVGTPRVIDYSEAPFPSSPGAPTSDSPKP